MDAEGTGFPVSIEMADCKDSKMNSKVFTGSNQIQANASKLTRRHVEVQEDRESKHMRTNPKHRIKAY